jgi:hypothetical protein
MQVTTQCPYDLEAMSGMNLDGRIQRATAAEPAAMMVDSGVKLHLEVPDLLLLLAGDTPTTTAYGVHHIPLPSGTYKVLTATYKKPGESVIIYRLARIGA